MTRDSRDFTDETKLKVTMENIKKNNGCIKCENCGCLIRDRSEMHFDHIKAFATGGKSTFDNCQILCVKCNESKNAKEMEEFILEKKAKEFLFGQNTEDTSNISNSPKIDFTSENTNEKLKKTTMSKEEFDKKVEDFIKINKKISLKDFKKVDSVLPPANLISVYYGNIEKMKKAFGLEETPKWNRDEAFKALSTYVDINGDIKTSDLISKNKLPSYPCLIKLFPEYNTFDELKNKLLGLNVKPIWTKETALSAGLDFLKYKNKLTLSDLNSANSLPSISVIERYFGSLAEYQIAIGSPVYLNGESRSKDTIHNYVEEYFGDNERIIEDTKTLFKTFKYPISTIQKKYGSLEKFYKEENIVLKKDRKREWLKEEIDEKIKEFVKNNNYIPKARDLTSLGLPSHSSIERFYSHWKEPFILFKKAIEKFS